MLAKNPFEFQLATVIVNDSVTRAQIEEKQYETELIANGIAPENIRKYGLAFEGKKCLIG